jgi:hypothetical protein
MMPTIKEMQIIIASLKLAKRYMREHKEDYENTEWLYAGIDDVTNRCSGRWMKEVISSEAFAK